MKKNLIAALALALTLPLAHAQAQSQPNSQIILPVANNVAGSEKIDKALSVLVPGDHQVKLNNMISPEVKLTWGAGNNWINVLSKALKEANLVAQYNQKEKTITVDPVK